MATDPLTDQLGRERSVRERSRWLVLAVIGPGFAAVVTALTAINVALPSANTKSSSQLRTVSGSSLHIPWPSA